MNEALTAASPWRSRVTSGAAKGTRWLAIAIGFTLPVSTAMDNILLVLLLAFWVASGRWQEKFAAIRANPVALAILALFALVTLGLAWSQGPLQDGLLYFRKYSNLLLTPILVTVFTDATDRQRGLFAFAAAMALTALLSLAIAAGALPTSSVITGVPGDPTVFKKHITQNLFMAFGFLVFAELARRSVDGRQRLLWAGLAAIAGFDVLLVHGRSGYLVLPVLVVLLLVQRWRWKGLAAAVVAVFVSFAAAYQLSNGFRERVSLAEVEARQWQPGVATQTSVGIRLEFYRNTLSIIEQHPFLGVGTGGFAEAYARQVQGTAMQPTYNPHNQYLLITAQLGVVGLALLLWVFVQGWHTARRLPREMDRTLARGLVLTYVIASLLNSVLIDHAEGLLFSWMSGLLFASLRSPEYAKAGHTA